MAVFQLNFIDKHRWLFRTGKSIVTESRLVVARAGGGRWRVTAQWVRVSVWGDEKVQELGSMMVAKHCECPKYHGIVHFKIAKLVNFMLSLYYHNKSKNRNRWPAHPACSLQTRILNSVDRQRQICAESKFEKDACEHGTKNTVLIGC